MKIQTYQENDSNILKFNGRVAIITGAARGLGREYALLLSSRGASVIVNDLGGSRDGTGKSSAADDVVKEIIERGGKAVADYNSVEDGHKIVQTAIDNFGRIDILINNAGILRDKSIMKMTAEDFDLVHKVHLRGSFLVTKAAWPYFRSQNYGRVIMTASPSGIYGNFGQANYSSAKLGLLSLAKTLAIEGEKYNIKCNTIVPVAASRLTEDLLPEDILDLFRPAYVAPIVAFLCHENCPVSGEILEAAGGYFGKYQWQRSKGKVFSKNSKTNNEDMISIEEIQKNWNQITDMTSFTNPTSIQNHSLLLIDQLKGYDESSKQEVVQVGNSNAKEFENRICFDLNANDSILYALSVGVSIEDLSNLKFLYENHENFSILPTMATTISLNAVYESSILSTVIDQYNLEDNLIGTLHGEQYLKVYEKISIPCKLYCEPKILDVLDKGSGALIIIEVFTFDSNGKLIFYNQLSFFMVGSGNFGGERSSKNANLIDSVEVPNDRPPDKIICQRTTLEQAAMFRLCGDKNPLHIDSNFSKIAGFNRPILHGLCMLGFAIRHVLSLYVNNSDASYLIACKARFVGTILPGQTIETHCWKSSSLLNNNNDYLVRIHFECFVKETGKKIISSGFVDLRTPLPEFIDPHSNNNIDENMTQTKTLTTNSISDDISDHDSSSSVKKCKVDRIFEGFLAEKIREKTELVSLINTVYQFNITKDGKSIGVWTMDLKHGKGEIYRGSRPNIKVDCTLTVDDDIITNIFEGKDDALQAFMSGRIKVTGNILAAQKLQQIWAEESKDTSSHSLIVQDKPKENDSKNDDDQELIKSIPTSGLKSDLIFTILRNRMHEEPELVRRMTAAYQFNITKNGKHLATWSAENKTNPLGAVYNQPYKNGKPDCLVTVEDNDLVNLMFGKLNPQRAFMMGKLKVKGNIMLLQRLNSIWLELQKSGKAPEIPYIVDLISKTDLMPGLGSEMMIIELIQRLIRLPYLCKELHTLVGFEIFKNGKIAAEYTLDFTKNDQTGVFERGLPSGDNYCVLTMTDEDFIRLTYHKFTLEQGIQSKRIKVRGDQNVIGRISIIFKTPTSRVKL